MTIAATRMESAAFDQAILIGDTSDDCYDTDSAILPS